ncbi:kelch repeat-containing protein, partial [Croceitalea vernalis]
EIPAEGVYRLDNHLWLWVASNGGLFHAGPSENMHWVDLTGTGSVSAAYSRGGDSYSMKGTTVMFDIDKILKVGGSQSYGNNTPAKENAFVIDINVPFNTAPNVQQTPDMEFERTMHNSTVLPNGQVLVTGGLDHAEVFSDNGAQLYAELFTPNGAGTNGTWETLSYMATPRTYHSVAILLTDGTVFSGGGGLSLDAFNHFNGEIFYPPYLFETDGSFKERPYINAPATSNYST